MENQRDRSPCNLARLTLSIVEIRTWRSSPPRLARQSSIQWRSGWIWLQPNIDVQQIGDEELSFPSDLIPRQLVWGKASTQTSTSEQKIVASIVTMTTLGTPSPATSAEGSRPPGCPSGSQRSDPPSAWTRIPWFRPWAIEIRR